MAKFRFQKVYLEITNVCNLNCSFCPGTSRPGGRITPAEFLAFCEKLRPYTDCLYLHLMGEPTAHPELKELLDIGTELGFRLRITTNGTLLQKRGDLLLNCPGVDKISISVHSFEANGGVDLDRYLDSCLDFVARAAETGKKAALRLWNLDGTETVGENRRNEEILARFRDKFPGPWKDGPRGVTLAPRVFLEWGEKFNWPDLQSEGEEQTRLFCRGLRDQLGVLWDGTVVPCCLDHNGEIPLGNLREQTVEEILNSPRAKNLYEGFSRRQAVEPLCRTCGYARRF